MKTTSTERQTKHRDKMRAMNLTLVQVWVPHDRVFELRSFAANLTKQTPTDFAPSERQLAFAKFLCDKKGLTLPQKYLSSSKDLSHWLNANKSKPDKRP